MSDALSRMVYIMLLSRSTVFLGALSLAQCIGARTPSGKSATQVSEPVGVGSGWL